MKEAKIRFVFVNACLVLKVGKNGVNHVPPDDRRQEIVEHELTTGPAHALAEMFGWSHGLKKTPAGAPEFYAVIVLSTGVAIAIGLSGFNPISALFWASMIMGLLAPPLMLVIMLAVDNRRIMGEHTNGRWLKLLGWLTTAAVSAAAAGLIWSWIH